MPGYPEIRRNWRASGIYGSDIQISNVPTLLRLRLLLGVDAYEMGSFKFDVRVLNGRQKLFEATGVAEISKGSTFSLLGTGPIALTVEEEMELTFQGRINEDRFKTLHTLPVRHKPS